LDRKRVCTKYKNFVFYVNLGDFISNKHLISTWQAPRYLKIH